MSVLVSDTSVIIDLEKGEFLVEIFQLEHDFSVPDLLFEKELKDFGGDELIKLGLTVEELSSSEVILAQQYGLQKKALSVSDTFALALAKERELRLLTGDGVMRGLAAEEGISCNGVLWLLDQLEGSQIVTSRKLFGGLTLISECPRCRIPKRHINERLDRYKSFL